MSESNCPNCGAPIEGIKCKYCGTYFFNLTDIDFNKPRYIRIPLGNKRVIFNVLADEVSITNNQAQFYANNIPVFSNPEFTIDIKLRVVPDEKGIMYLRKDLEED